MDKLQRDSLLRHVAQVREHPVLNHRLNRKIKLLALKSEASISQTFKNSHIGTSHYHQVKGGVALPVPLSERQGNQVDR